MKMVTRARLALQPRNRGLVALAVAGIALSATLPAHTTSPTEDTARRQAMHRVFAAMQQLLPFALAQESSLGKTQLAEARHWIDGLVDETEALQAHHEKPAEGFEHLSRSLAADAKSLQRRFARGQTLQAQFYVLALTDTCVACHSRLPKKRDFQVREGLFEAGAKHRLDPRSSVRLLVATRQFDAALEEWEALFADLARTPSSIGSSGFLDDYLTVAIRVEGNPARALGTLQIFSRRTDLPRYLRHQLEAWSQALIWLAEQPEPTPGLPAARALITRAEAASRLPVERAGRVYDLAASSLLHRMIAESTTPLAVNELSEALYLLGKVEARGPADRWVSEAETHLERAIRLTPAASFAQEAFDLLRDYTLFQYGGASGSPIPKDRVDLLEELSDLIDRSTPAPPQPSSLRAALVEG